jgi:hypothetical protein
MIALGSFGVAVNKGWDKEALTAVEGWVCRLHSRMLGDNTARYSLRQIILKGVMMQDKVLILDWR